MAHYAMIWPILKNVLPPKERVESCLFRGKHFTAMCDVVHVS